MPNYKDFYGSEFLNANDLQSNSVDASIKMVIAREIAENQGGEIKQKLVAYFHELELPMILNATNATTLGSAVGEDYSKWVDVPVTIYKTSVNFKGRMVAALRLSIRPKSSAAAGANV